MSASGKPLHPAALVAAALALVGASVAGTLAFAPRGADRSAGQPAPSSAPDDASHAAVVVLSEAARANAHVEIGTAGPGRLSTSIAMPGEVALNADRLVHVTPRISGVVRDVVRQLGDDVRRGDVLATLESRELADLMREARATSERTKLARANFDRLDALYREGVAPQKDQLSAKSELDEAKILEEAASQALAAAGGGSGGATYALRAPIDGRIIEKHLTSGEVLKDDTRVFVIADLSTVWVDLNIYAKDLPRVAVGQDVRVRAEGIDEPVSGAISFIGATVATDARTTTARVVVSRAGERFRPGLFVVADVTVAREDVPLLVEASAVQTLDGEDVVFVEVETGFEARRVVLGARGRTEDGARAVAVTSGLAAGERYAKTNAFVLKAELGKGAAHDD